jgi:hypothetical protein
MKRILFVVLCLLPVAVQAQSVGYIEASAAQATARTVGLPYVVTPRRLPAAGSGTVTSASVTTANGVSGTVATSTTTPAFTFTLGAITPTTVNGNTFTTGTYTLTGTAGKTFTFNNSITLAGTDGTTITAPAASDTLAGLGTAQTYVKLQTYQTGAADGNNIASNTTAIPASPPASVFTPNTFFITAPFAANASNFCVYGYANDTGTNTGNEGGGGVFRYTCSTTSNSVGHGAEVRNDAKGVAGQYDGLFVFMDASQASFTNSQFFNGIFIRPEIYLANGTTPSTTGINAAIHVNACVGGASQYALLASNAIAVGSVNGSFGWAGGTGAGASITQITSRSTGVTANTPNGIIQLVSAAGSILPTSFIVSDSVVGALDSVQVIQLTGADAYEIFTTAVTAGAFKVTFFTTGGTTTEQPVFKFFVIKGSNN